MPSPFPSPCGLPSTHQSHLQCSALLLQARCSLCLVAESLPLLLPVRVSELQAKQRGLELLLPVDASGVIRAGKEDGEKDSPQISRYNGPFQTRDFVGHLCQARNALFLAIESYTHHLLA